MTAQLDLFVDMEAPPEVEDFPAEWIVAIRGQHFGRV